jgi:hypothetical protein
VCKHDLHMLVVCLRHRIFYQLYGPLTLQTTGSERPGKACGVESQLTGCDKIARLDAAGARKGESADAGGARKAGQVA